MTRVSCVTPVPPFHLCHCFVSRNLACSLGGYYARAWRQCVISLLKITHCCCFFFLQTFSVLSYFPRINWAQTRLHLHSRSSVFPWFSPPCISCHLPHSPLWITDPNDLLFSDQLCHGLIIWIPSGYTCLWFCRHVLLLALGSKGFWSPPPSSCLLHISVWKLWNQECDITRGFVFL